MTLLERPKIDTLRERSTVLETARMVLRTPRFEDAKQVAALASANCDTCHKAGYTAWTPAKVHTSATLVAQCAVCHAAIKPATAVHTGQTVCENCHKSTTAWAGASRR